MHFIHCDEAEFMNRVGNRRIVCFGASLMVKEAISVLHIEENVDFILDNNSEKYNTNILIGKRNYTIVSPEVLKDYCENYILLITTRFYEEILCQLNKMEELKDKECYAYLYLKLFIKEGTERYIQKRLVEPCLRTYEEVLDYRRTNKEQKKQLLEDKKKYINGDLTNGIKPVVIPRIVFSHSNRCNLKCKHCGAIIPGIEEPYIIPTAQIIRDIHLFLRSIDECLMVDVTDGEPLLNPELDQLLEVLINHDKVFSIFFYTNGTCIPKDRVLKLLSNEKVMVVISDYGFIEKMAKLIAVFEKENVNFQVMSDMLWMDTDSVEYRNRSDDFLKYHFLNCEAGTTRKRMAYGKLYTCTRSFRLQGMGFYQSVNDYVELAETDTNDVLREKIMKMYLADCADACNYCDYGNPAVNMVEAGIQENIHMKRSEYTFIKRNEYECLQKALKNTGIV